MADLTVNLFVGGSVTETLVAAAASQTLPYTGKEFLIVDNGDSGSHTLTLNSILACDQGSDHDHVEVIPAGERHIVKLPPPGERWRNDDGKVELTWSATTSMTVGAFRWPE